MNKTIVITGGAGFIGTNLCEFLVDSGYQLIVVDNLRNGDKARLPSGVTFEELDVRATQKLVSVFRDADFVIHLAAEPSVQWSIEHPQEAHDINVNGTLSVLEAATKAKVKRLVFAASSAVYGDQATLPLGTSTPTRPKSPYALHKLIGEEYLKLWSELYGLETVSLRFFNVYGPYFNPEGPYASVIGRFLKLANDQQALTITGDGSQTRDFVHIKDVCGAITAALKSDRVGQGEVLNVGSGVQTSVLSVAKAISDDIVYLPPRIEPAHSLADISETKAVLGWEPTVSFEAGLAELKAHSS
jgi:UDP-glucose 4-epimerase